MLKSLSITINEKKNKEAMNLKGALVSTREDMEIKVKKVMPSYNDLKTNFKLPFFARHQ